MKKNLVLQLLLVPSFLVYGNPVDWEMLGRTGPDCSFQAAFYRLNGFPFAKLEVSQAGGSEVVPLVLEEVETCKRELYSTAFPRSNEIPTYSVTVTDFCYGSVPKLSVSAFYSGATRHCKLERGLADF